MIREYSLGCVAESTKAAHGLRPAMIATIRTGNTIRIPKTAMAMPQVMKRRRHTGSISRSTVALTTALSNESETSSTASTATMKVVCRTPATVPDISQPIAAPPRRPRSVTKKEPRKYFIELGAAERRRSC